MKGFSEAATAEIVKRVTSVNVRKDAVERIIAAAKEMALNSGHIDDKEEYEASEERLLIATRLLIEEEAR